MIKSWVERRITELLGDDDDIVSNMVISQLEISLTEAQCHPDKSLDPKMMQVNLTGKCMNFMYKI